MSMLLQINKPKCSTDRLAETSTQYNPLITSQRYKDPIKSKSHIIHNLISSSFLYASQTSLYQVHPPNDPFSTSNLPHQYTAEQVEVAPTSNHTLNRPSPS